MFNRITNKLMPLPEPTKELVLICEGGIKGSLDVTSSATLQEVREQIEDELDDDLIPEDFAFHMVHNDARISKKQEKKKKAWDFLGSDGVSMLSIRSKRQPECGRVRKLDEASILAVGKEMWDTVTPIAKRQKVHCGNSTSVDVNGFSLNHNNSSSVVLQEPSSGNIRMIQEPRQISPDSDDREKVNVNALNAHPVQSQDRNTENSQEDSKYGMSVPKPPSINRELGKVFQTNVKGVDALRGNSENAGIRELNDQKEGAIDIPAPCHSVENGIIATGSVTNSPVVDKDTQLDTCKNDESTEKSSHDVLEVRPAVVNEKSTDDVESLPRSGNAAHNTEVANKKEEDFDSADRKDNNDGGADEEMRTVEKTASNTDPRNNVEALDEKGADVKSNVNDVIISDVNMKIPETGMKRVNGKPDAAVMEAACSSPDRENVVQEASANGDGNQMDEFDAQDTSFETCQDDHNLSDEESIDLCEDEDKSMDDEDDRKLPAKPDDAGDENKSSDDVDLAVQNCRSVLTSIDQILKENPLFCSHDRRMEWSKEIGEHLAESSPKTIIGVLGNTGVGKSSLLNALLDEASVLPTSGSRGCTAAVVELRYNSDLENQNADGKEVPVYKGEVEFMTRQEWLAELKILVDECSTQQKTVYLMEPDPRSSAEAAAAWAKIDQVYGRGTMIGFKGEPSIRAYKRLAGNFRLIELLTPPRGSIHPYNVIPVQEGEVIPGSQNARALVGSFQDMNTRMRRSKKKWAQSFRSKINSYVYRKGNGDLPQTWPLIRKVVLHGPWACLSTGACLVDLPGVRDANAARAKVSEGYLQNCNQIWVVAPIKRAVDDGTAKELLGEQFKRRLLMDGQYGNVSFICTQTDDCEATEIMRDHSDVARNVEGRWERMTVVLSKITEVERAIGDLREQEEDLKTDHDEKGQWFNELVEDVDGGEDSGELSEAQFSYEAAGKKLEKWRDDNLVQIGEMQDECEGFQRELKALCAAVRNEYSTKCLQDDFKDGLKALYRSSDEDDGDQNAQNPPATALPEDFEMDVHCISSNDYLKLQGIKPKSDGPPATFSKAEDTQIPNLRVSVHQTTSRLRKVFAKSFVNHTSDILERVKLLAVDAANIGSGRSSLRCMRSFEREVDKIGGKIRPMADKFSSAMKEKIKLSLQPALKTGAKKGVGAAMPILESWGSKSRRSRHHRSPENNGLYYATYMATARRQGVFTSGSAGAIDMNQELCDPMEKEFSVNWQRIMDNALRTHLTECENQVQAICSTVNQAIAAAFEKEGMDKSRISNMTNTAGRGSSNAVKQAFSTMRRVATETQRNLNRSLLPTVQEQMVDSYDRTVNVQRGTGTFNRMKEAMQKTTKKKVKKMFDKSTLNLLEGIDAIVKELVSLIIKTGESISTHLESVYSICWDDRSEKSQNMDPEMQRKVRACRDALLPQFNNIFGDLKEIQDKMGIEREELDLDVMAVDSLESAIQKKIAEAEEKGEVIDLCDSDVEIEVVLSRLPPKTSNAKSMPTMRIKADPAMEDDFGVTL